MRKEFITGESLGEEGEKGSNNPKMPMTVIGRPQGGQGSQFSDFLK